MLLAANIFQPLIDVFAAVLKFFHNDIGVSWGFSIVLLTVFLRLALVPLGIRQFHNMQRMAQHMPEMKAIRERYKDNPQRMQQETMKFYKEKKVNPLSSCLPLLIQWPFLIGMFWTLRGNLRDDICPSVQHSYRVNLAAKHHESLARVAGQTTACNGSHGSSCLFIHDLTNTAHGLSVIVLLVFYIGTSLGSSMIMMMPGTDPNQRRMMLILPVVFSIFFIRFPAGAILYYIIFNLWMIVQQSVFKELIGQQYRHPAGESIGIPGDGSVSSGGGIRGLFGLSRTKVSDEGGGDPLTDPVPDPPRRGRPRRGGDGAQAGLTATAAPASTARSGAGTATKISSSNASRPSGPPPSARKKKKRSGRKR